MIKWRASATVQIIVITCIVSFLCFIIGDPAFRLLELVPSAVIDHYALWLLLTHIFVHGNFIHLFANMFSLWFIGGTTEKILGRKRFIGLYFTAGIIAGILSVILAYYLVGDGVGTLARIFGTKDIAMVGASGAIFGLAGVLAALIPRARVFLLSGPLFAIIISAVLENFITSSVALGVLNFVITAYIFLCLFSMISFNPRYGKLALPLSIPLWLLPFVAILPLIIVSIFVPLNIGNIAHFAGFAVGWLYGIFLKRKYPQKTNMLQRYFR